MTAFGSSKNNISGLIASEFIDSQLDIKMAVLYLNSYSLQHGGILANISGQLSDVKLSAYIVMNGTVSHSIIGVMSTGSVRVQAHIKFNCTGALSSGLVG